MGAPRVGTMTAMLVSAVGTGPLYFGWSAPERLLDLASGSSLRRLTPAHAHDGHTVSADTGVRVHSRLQVIKTNHVERLLSKNTSTCTMLFLASHLVPRTRFLSCEGISTHAPISDLAARTLGSIGAD